MTGLTTRSLLACFTLALACGDTDAGSSASASGSTSLASTGPASTSSTSTGTDPGTTTVPTTSSATSTASSSSGEAPTTGAIDSTGPASTTTGDPSTTTSTSTTDPGTSTTTNPGSSSSDGGNAEPPPPPTMPAGCNVCDCCDPWPISWAAVPEATHYVVRWKCSINPEQVHDVGDKTAIADVCNDIEMCNGMCVFTVGYIKVQACNDDGCSALVDIPAAPITCGGGCCC